MSAGTLVAWHVKPGDRVRRGDIVADVETDKGVIAIEIFADGVVNKLVVQPGQRVPVGTALAVIDDGAATASAPAVIAPPTIATLPKVEAPAKPVTAELGRVRISPAARILAQLHGLDISTVRGTGPNGAITREDVEHAATAKPGVSTPSAKQPDAWSRMRETIAAAMSRSKREIPHYYLSTTIDMHLATTWLTQENQRRSVADRLLYGVLLLKAVALALRELPELNSLWVNGKAVRQEDIHVGVAISLRQGGLVAPAIHDVDQLALSELMSKFRDLVSRVRTGGLRASELADPTITVTSLGEQGVESVFPIINPPQVAIVGFGKMMQRPWVVENHVVPRTVMTATLAADHRVSDGHRGGLFLAALDRLLQEPSKL